MAQRRRRQHQAQKRQLVVCRDRTPAFEAEQGGSEAVYRRGSAMLLKFHPGAKIDPAKLMTLVAENEGAQFTPAGVLRLPLTVPPDHAPGVLEFLKKALETLAPGVHSV